MNPIHAKENLQPATQHLRAGVSGATTLLVGATLAAITILILAVFSMTNTRNPYTPPGYVGYLTRGSFWGHAAFAGVQTGPTSAGRSWWLNVINVSVTPYTYDEDFVGDSAVLSIDNLPINLRIHIVWRVRPEAVRDLVENYSTLHLGDSPDKIAHISYDNFVREPLRTFVRDEVGQIEADALKERLPTISNSILRHIQQSFDKTPFEVRRVAIGNVGYPPVLTEATARKVAVVRELDRSVAELEAVRRETEKGVVQAEGRAREMEAISSKLTPLFLKYEALRTHQANPGPFEQAPIPRDSQAELALEAPPVQTARSAKR